MDNVVYTIFGGTGDLSYRKLMPAFYNLFARGLLGENTCFLALGRRDWDKEKYLSEIEDWVREFARFPVTDASFAEFSDYVDYLRVDFTKAEDYNRLFSYYEKFSGSREKIRHIFYYAVAPGLFPVITDNLLSTGCLQGICRVVIEKPFGEDLEQARAISEKLSSAFGEDQVYHIDHYLGKEMVLNIATIRRANALFKAAWNKDYIDSVEISALESIDIGNRGAYYDDAGALKDMIQGHLFQVLTIIAMEDTADPDSPAFTAAQENLLQALRPPEAPASSQLALGQYEGYRESKDVAPDSTTESYAAVKVLIDNPRWEGVPFYLRSGKALKERKTYVTVKFKQFSEKSPQNILHIEIQPQEGIRLSFNIKKPGSRNEIEKVSMDFCQSCNIEAHSNTPEAYERLLLAACRGQKEYFTPWQQIESSWEWMHQLRQLKEEEGLVPEVYPRGSWGPGNADALLAESGRRWENETDTLI